MSETGGAVVSYDAGYGDESYIPGMDEMMQW